MALALAQTCLISTYCPCSEGSRARGTMLNRFTQSAVYIACISGALRELAGHALRFFLKGQYILTKLVNSGSPLCQAAGFAYTVQAFGPVFRSLRCLYGVLVINFGAVALKSTSNFPWNSYHSV